MIQFSATRTRAVLVVALLAIGQQGCGGDTPSDENDLGLGTGDVGVDTADVDFSDIDTSVDLGDVPFDAVEPDECDVIDRVTAVRLRSVPGGRQLHLRLADQDDQPLDGSFGSCLSVTDATLGELPTAWSRSDAGPGATLIVARWSSDEVEASRAFIDALIAARPSDERIAVWAWSDQLVQVVGATTDRGRIAARLDAVWTADDAAPLDIVEMATQAAEDWEALARGALLGSRDIVFVAPDLDLADHPAMDRDYVLDHWVVGASSLNRTYELGEAAATAAAISERLDAGHEAGFGVLAFCDAGGALELTISSGDREVRALRAGDAGAENIGAPCDLQLGLTIEPSAAPVLDFEFTAEQRGIFDQFSRDRIKDDFAASLRVDGRGSTGVTANFRGQSSLGCARKSLAVNLFGGDARHILPNSGTDKFYLISMCLDDRYVNQINANRILQRMGAWFVEFGTVEVRFDGATQGVYLFIEEIPEELENDISRARAVIRRRTDIDGKAPESKWSFDTDEDAVARYEAFLASFEGLEGAALVQALRERMDLDQYLRWISMMTLLSNGDYVDEVFFVAEETVNADHEVGDYYSVHGWDADDLFSDCHHDGRFAIDDPNGLLYCTESVLDHLIFADETVYELFVSTLEQTLADFTPEVFDAIVDGTHDELMGWFSDGAIRGAMVEVLDANPDASTEAGFAAEIRGASDQLQQRYAERRQLLLGAIDAYRGLE